MKRDLPGTWMGFWDRPAADPGVVRKHQEDRLRRLVEHAWLNVPYYRRRFEQAGLHPADIRSLDDLPLIPISRKADFRLTSFNDRIASGINPDRCIRRVTAGSTGEPTHLLRTRYEEYLLFAYRQRVGRYAGVRLWEKRAAVMNGEKRRYFAHRLVGIARQLEIDAFLEIEEILGQLRAYRPAILGSTPQNFERILRALRPDDLNTIQPRLLVCGGELLTPTLRRRITETFQKPLLDMYGAHQFNLVAWECPHCGVYHTCDDTVIVEVLREDGTPAAPGEEGRVIGTALESFAMPILRFELGDLARRPKNPRPCRVRFGTIESVLGRSTDSFRLPDGRVFNSYRLVHALRKEVGIGRFQVVQEELDRVRVRYEALPDAPADLGRTIVARCREQLPPEVAVHAGQVDEIQPGPGGKLQLIRSVHSRPEAATGSSDHQS